MISSQSFFARHPRLYSIAFYVSALLLLGGLLAVIYNEGFAASLLLVAAAACSIASGVVAVPGTTFAYAKRLPRVMIDGAVAQRFHLIGEDRRLRADWWEFFQDRDVVPPESVVDAHARLAQQATPPDAEPQVPDDIEECVKAERDLIGLAKAHPGPYRDALSGLVLRSENSWRSHMKTAAASSREVTSRLRATGVPNSLRDEHESLLEALEFRNGVLGQAGDCSWSDQWLEWKRVKDADDSIEEAFTRVVASIELELDLNLLPEEPAAGLESQESS